MDIAAPHIPLATDSDLIPVANSQSAETVSKPRLSTIAIEKGKKAAQTISNDDGFVVVREFLDFPFYHEGLELSPEEISALAFFAHVIDSATSGPAEKTWDNYILRVLGLGRTNYRPQIGPDPELPKLLEKLPTALSYVERNHRDNAWVTSDIRTRDGYIFKKWEDIKKLHEWVRDGIRKNPDFITYASHIFETEISPKPGQSR